MTHNLFIFFFSSRRRHTRLQGDWSSDVCSSDLDPADPENRRDHLAGGKAGGAWCSPSWFATTLTRTARPNAFQRSEEHTSELQSPCNLVCRLLLEKKKKKRMHTTISQTKHDIRR